MPKPTSEEALELMKLIDRYHLKHPYFGSRRIRDWLADEGLGQSRACTASDVHDGPCRAVSEAQSLSARPGAQGLSVSAQGAGD